MFSGGIDSGAVLVVLDHLAAVNPRRVSKRSLSRLTEISDSVQARQFLQEIDREIYLEVSMCHARPLMA